jgi:anti-sigma B factor antagonist
VRSAEPDFSLANRPAALLFGPDLVDRTPFISDFVRVFHPRRPAMVANPVSLPELSLETVKGPEEIVVRCVGRITSITSGTLQAAVRALIPETSRVVLDLTDVSYLDSSGLGALVGLYVSAKRQHCDLKLINLNQRLKQLFRLTKMAAIFEGHEDLLGMTPD